jgi:hypothetical protein
VVAQVNYNFKGPIFFGYVYHIPKDDSGIVKSYDVKGEHSATLESIGIGAPKIFSTRKEALTEAIELAITLIGK